MVDRINLIVADRHTERGAVGAQLVFATCDRRQAVAGQGPAHFEQLDPRLGIGFAGDLPHLHESLRIFLESATVGQRPGQLGPPRRDGFVVFLDGLLEKHVLIHTARRRLNREDHESGGLTVDAVDRREIIEAERPFQTDQKRFLHVATTRDDGEKVGLVGNDQIIVLEHHHFVERDARLGWQRAVIVNA